MRRRPFPPLPLVHRHEDAPKDLPPSHQIGPT
jgi:hypothetical protein